MPPCTRFIVRDSLLKDINAFLCLPNEAKPESILNIFHPFLNTILSKDMSKIYTDITLCNFDTNPHTRYLWALLTICQLNEAPTEQCHITEAISILVQLSQQHDYPPAQHLLGEIYLSHGVRTLQNSYVELGRIYFERATQQNYIPLYSIPKAIEILCASAFHKNSPTNYLSQPYFAHERLGGIFQKAQQSKHSASEAQASREKGQEYTVLSL